MSEPITFPRERVVRTGDEVVVHHAGETRTYESPEALAAAFRAFDRTSRDRFARLQARLAETKALEREARQLLYLARADRRRIHNRQRLAGFFCGIMFTLIVGVLLAGLGQ